MMVTGTLGVVVDRTRAGSTVVIRVAARTGLTSRDGRI